MYWAGLPNKTPYWKSVHCKSRPILATEVIFLFGLTGSEAWSWHCACAWLCAPPLGGTSEVPRSRCSALQEATTQEDSEGSLVQTRLSEEKTTRWWLKVAQTLHPATQLFEAGLLVDPFKWQIDVTALASTMNME